jgi:cytoskeletal protein RodZ
MAETVGRTLADARRDQRKTLADVEEATRIRGKLIEALEADDHESLPDPAYVRGYIISYAKFLDLDPKPLLAQYAQEVGQEQAATALREPEPVVSGRDTAHNVPWRITAIIIGIVLVAALAYWGLGRLFSGGDEDELPPVPPVAEETATPDPAIEPTTPGVTETETLDAAPEEEAPADLPFTVEVIVSDEAASWLKVTVDDLDAYEGTLAAGQSKEWDVTAEIVILVGKPEAVTVLRDGAEVPMPPGAVPEIRLTSTDPQE